MKAWWVEEPGPIATGPLRLGERPHDGEDHELLFTFDGTLPSLRFDIGYGW